MGIDVAEATLGSRQGQEHLSGEPLAALSQRRSSQLVAALATQTARALCRAD